MKTDMISQEENRVVIKAEMSSEDFRKQVDMTVRDLSGKVNIPGFRKGKVPRKVLEMRFTKEAIYSETLDHIMPNVINEIVNDYELDLIEEPDLKIDNMNEGEPLELTFTFEVKPEVTLAELSKIEVPKREVDVTDEMVEATIHQAREQFAMTEIIEDRTAVQAADLVDVSYSTRILDQDDNEIKAHEPGETTIDLGTEGLRQEIVTALEGREIGAQVEVDVPIEEDNPDGEIAGQRAIYSFEIRGIKAKKLPEMDQEFFQKVTGEESLSLEDFTAKMKDGIAARLENEIRTEMEDIAVNRLAEMSEFTVPETLVKRQEESIRKQDEENFKKRFNKTIDEFLDEGSMDREEYESNLKDQAQKSVGRYLVMDALSTQENVDVTKEDIHSEIAQIASSYGIDPERLMGSILQDPDRIGEISNRIRYRKTVDILLDSVTVTEETSTDKAEETPESGVTED